MKELSEDFRSYMESRKSSNYEDLKNLCFRDAGCLPGGEGEEIPGAGGYPQQLPAGVSSSHLLGQCGGQWRLREAPEARSSATIWRSTRRRRQSRPGSAVEHFKDDFIYKIRSAIKEALTSARTS